MSTVCKCPQNRKESVRDGEMHYYVIKQIQKTLMVNFGGGEGDI